MKIAVLIPCYNEAQTIGKVVKDFQQELPSSDIYVYDNNSTDQTIQVAKDAGAIVRTESFQGKGHVVRRMFADIDADIYIMVDGDATYDSQSSKEMINKLLSGPYDMVNGLRVSQEKEAYRFGHTAGNKLLTTLVSKLFGHGFKDMLSGYRVFSRRFVKTFPCLSAGFEIETELTVHALSLHMPVAEISTPYYSRPEGSVSKLSTYKDGWRILCMILGLLRKERPIFFFHLSSLMLALIGIGIGLPVVIHYFETGFVPRLPSALLASALMILSSLSLTCGFILEAVTGSRKETKKLAYLTYLPPKVE